MDAKTNAEFTKSGDNDIVVNVKPKETRRASKEQFVRFTDRFGDFG